MGKQSTQCAGGMAIECLYYIINIYHAGNHPEAAEPEGVGQHGHPPWEGVHWQCVQGGELRAPAAPHCHQGHPAGVNK